MAKQKKTPSQASTLPPLAADQAAALQELVAALATGLEAGQDLATLQETAASAFISAFSFSLRPSRAALYWSGVW